MEQLSRIKARRENLHDLRDLFRAMRGMAAAHVQEAQKALKGIREYVASVETALADGARLLPDSAGSSPVSGAGSSGLVIVVCSDHGFTGAFNDRLLEKALSRLDANRQLGIIGQRGLLLAQEHQLNPSWSHPMATHVGGVINLARQITEKLAHHVEVEIIFARYDKGARYDVVAKQILPIDPDLLRGRSDASPPLHHLDALHLLGQLTEEYLFGEITQAIMESLASENGARLQVMQAADRNAGDKLTQLQRRERSLRQEAITAELLELATGVEAIMKDNPA